MFGGLSLMVLPYINNIWLILFCVMMSGTFLAMAWPLVDAVYTDLVSRARRGRKHIMGMSAAAFSLAYIIGPIFSGWLSGLFGEIRVFFIIGSMVVMVAAVLLVVTPKKLLLPQDEMKNWE